MNVNYIKISTDKVVKKKMLKDFALQPIINNNNLKNLYIFNFKNGEKESIITYPHGGIYDVII